MKRYEPLLPVGIFTNTAGTYVKIEDVETAIDQLSTYRESVSVVTKDDASFQAGYQKALEDVRREVRNGV